MTARFIPTTHDKLREGDRIRGTFEATVATRDPNEPCTLPILLVGGTSPWLLEDIDLAAMQLSVLEVPAPVTVEEMAEALRASLTPMDYHLSLDARDKVRKLLARYDASQAAQPAEEAPASRKLTMTINLTEAEQAVLESLSTRKDLPPERVLIQGLKLYQLQVDAPEQLAILSAEQAAALRPVVRWAIGYYGITTIERSSFAAAFREYGDE